MNSYQVEQQDALVKADAYLKALSAGNLQNLQAVIRPYLMFREHVDDFLKRHCSQACTQNCYKSKTSACCSKDGIITFWADVLINANCSDNEQLERLMVCIQRPRYNDKCIYLGDSGCCWQVRPLVCTMFLCDSIQQELIEKDKRAHDGWATLQSQAKSFRWPDRPVLFDQLEQHCIAAGIQSPLMYINTSPGLLKIKQMAALKAGSTDPASPLS